MRGARQSISSNLAPFSRAYATLAVVRLPASPFVRCCAGVSAAALAAWGAACVSLDDLTSGGAFAPSDAGDDIAPRGDADVPDLDAGTDGESGGPIVDGSVPLASNTALSLATADSHTCTVLGNGQLACWGDNASGQIGFGDQRPRPRPAYAVPTPLAVSKVWTGGATTCVQYADTSAECWGAGDKGQLGYGDLVMRTYASGQLLFTRVTQMAVGTDHVCAETANGLACWGANDHGQLGYGDTMARITAATASGVALTFTSNLVAGPQATCVNDGNSAVRCWGGFGFGRLGTGSASGDALAPAAVQNGTDEVAKPLAMGASHGCYIVKGGSLRCSGSNVSGELGVATPAQSAVPAAQVAGLSAVMELAVGLHHTCARTTTTIYCWGANDVGQLGVATPAQSTTPISIAVPGTPSRIAAGPNHTCALNTVGAVYCWGANAGGQLGDGTTFPRSVPTLVRFGP